MLLIALSREFGIAHLPDYGRLRRDTARIVDAVSSLRIGQGGGATLEPELKLTELRPPREVWGPPKEKAVVGRKPQSPAATKTATSAGGVTGAGGIKGLLTSIAASIVGRPSPSSAVNDEDDEAEGYAPMPPLRVSFNGTMGGKKPGFV